MLISLHGKTENSRITTINYTYTNKIATTLQISLGQPILHIIEELECIRLDLLTGINEVGNVPNASVAILRINFTLARLA